jgi:peptidoglycan/LPS O-acetylase OafA/YrhL
MFDHPTGTAGRGGSLGHRSRVAVSVCAAIVGHQHRTAFLPGCSLAGFLGTRNLLLLAGAGFVSYFANCLFVYPALADLLGYFFFPFHLFLFILGMLACRHSEAFLARVSRPFKIAMVAALFGGLAFSQFLPATLRNFICIALVALSLPILFDWTKYSRFQKWVGDLSYPVYICHVLVKWVLLGLMGVSKKDMTSPPGWLLLIGAIAMAALLLWVMDYPIDRWRQRRVKSLLRQPRPAAAT